MAKTNSKDKGYLCPQCGKDIVRTQVDLTVDIPSSMEHRLSKRNIASKDVVPMGATWDLATSYCPCGWSMSLRAKRFDVLMAENARLRAALRGVVDVDRQYMVLLGQGGEQYCNAIAVATTVLEEP